MLPNYEKFIWWKGVVEDRMDPLFLGRCRVRIFGHHPKFKKPIAEDANDDPSSNYLATEELPWAYPVQPITSAAMTGIGHAPVGPVEGTWVFGFFMDGEDCQLPVIVGTVGGIEMKDQNSTPSIGGSPAPGNVGTDTESGAPASTLPTFDGVLGPLSQEEVQKLKDALGQRESSGDYNATNKYGYIGKYQFGNAALYDVGLTKSKSNKNDVLDNSENWTGKNGATSKAAFLKSPDAQEKAMDDLLKRNYNTLVTKGAITSSSSKEEVAGLLAASHLVGAGGAVNLKNGADSGDANGTKASSYYSMGAGAVGKAGLPKPPAAGDSNPPANFANSPNKPTSDPSSFDDAIGFKDPNKIYPRMEDFDKRPDTNFLAYNDHTDHTNVKKKEEGRKTGVTVANDKDKKWDQPKPPYNAAYPYNHVYESENGHVLEFDDTKENERISLWHKIGTFLEIDRNGTQVNKIIGDGYWILDRHGFIVIGGKCNVTVEGSANIYVKNEANIQVDGKTELKAYNDVNMEVSGDMKVSVRESFCLRAKSIHMETEEIDGESFTLKNKSDGAIRIESIGKIEAFAEKDMNLFSNEKLSIRATGNRVAIDGSVGTFIQKGQSNVAHLVDASLPGDFEMFEPDEKKSPTEPEFPELIVPSHEDKVAFFYDEPGYPPDEVNAYIRQQIDNGTYKENDISDQDKDTFEPPDDAAPPPDTKTPEKCPDGFELQDNYSPALQLSTNFTLGAVSSGAAVTHSAVVEQHGLTKGQIVCNLRSLCRTSLETIKAQYPNMFVTSGFRTKSGSGAKVSQHELGEAADMQFKGVSKQDYYEIAKWIRDNVTFDQLILEYKTTGSGMPWIHISCSQKGNRKQILTMMNHKVVAGTLNNLA